MSNKLIIKIEKSNLYNNESTYIYCSAIRSLVDEQKINGGIAIVFDSTFQFNAMLDETLPRNNKGEKVDGVFALFTNKNKNIISSTNEEFKIDSFWI